MIVSSKYYDRPFSRTPWNKNLRPLFFTARYFVTCIDVCQVLYPTDVVVSFIMWMVHKTCSLYQRLGSMTDWAKTIYSRLIWKSQKAVTRSSLSTIRSHDHIYIGRILCQRCTSEIIYDFGWMTHASIKSLKRCGKRHSDNPQILL